MTLTTRPEGWTPKDSIALVADIAAHNLWLHLIGQATWTVRDLRAKPWHPREGDQALDRLRAYGLIAHIATMTPASPKSANRGVRIVGWKLTPKGVEWATETLTGALVTGHISEEDLPAWIANAVVEICDEKEPSWRRDRAAIDRAVREARA